jgi:hypothetical protein
MIAHDGAPACRLQNSYYGAQFDHAQPIPIAAPNGGYSRGFGPGAGCVL